MNRLQITADLYEIDIKDRILESGFIYNTIKFTKHLKFDVGANNLFDIIPPHPPNDADSPVGGGRVYSVPYGFAPWGVDGGYYYGRFTYSF